MKKYFCLHFVLFLLISDKWSIISWMMCEMGREAAEKIVDEVFTDCDTKVGVLDCQLDNLQTPMLL